jgi:hypothetical protein
LFFGLRCEGLDGFLTHECYGHRFHVHLHSAGLDLRKVQQIVDEGAEPVDVLGGRVEQLPVPLLERLLVALF